MKKILLSILVFAVAAVSQQRPDFIGAIIGSQKAVIAVPDMRGSGRAAGLMDMVNGTLFRDLESQGMASIRKAIILRKLTPTVRPPTGKGALGTVEGRRVALGNAAFLREQGVDVSTHDAEADELRGHRAGQLQDRGLRRRGRR